MPEEEIRQLRERIEKIEAELDILLYSDRYLIRKNLQMQDGRNIQTGRGRGTIICLDENERLGFFGTTPVVQQAAIGDTTVAGTAQDSDARTTINSILARLRNYGLLNT